MKSKSTIWLTDEERAHIAEIKQWLAIKTTSDVIRRAIRALAQQNPKNRSVVL